MLVRVASFIFHRRPSTTGHASLYSWRKGQLRVDPDRNMMEPPPTARATQQFLLLQQFLTGILAMHIAPEPLLAAPLPEPAPALPPPPPPRPLPPPPPPLMVRRPRQKAKAKAKAPAKAPARRPTTTGRDEFPGDDSMDGGGGGAAGGGGGVGGGAAGPGGGGALVAA